METCFSKPWDVFIIGGGPAGLATAIAARRHNLSVLLADGAVPPIDKPCGEGLLPNGVQALRQLGITIPEGHAFPFRGIRFISEGVEVQAEFPQGRAYGIRRTHLHRALLAEASACGVEMRWQAAVTGLHAEGALVAGKPVRARFVVGADGTGSRVRRWANLDRHSFIRRQEINRRFAFRRHYRVRPWTEFMELHWGRDCQIYVTPIGREEVCVALISSSPKSRLRTDDALAEFPELKARLENAPHSSSERGAITVTRRLRRVFHGRTVLVGDASGGVDAATGEGLCLTFRQAALLGECLASGDLARYQKGHRTLLRRPALTAQMMLFLARQQQFRRHAMQVFQSRPQLFARMLAMHISPTSTQGGQLNRSRSGMEAAAG